MGLKCVTSANVGKPPTLRIISYGCETARHSGMPAMQGAATYKKSENELICKADRLAFPIKDGIPVMLEDEARKFPPEVEIR